MHAVSQIERKLSSVDRDHFIGRTAEIERLLSLAIGTKDRAGIALLAPPASGASELLKQVYDRLFLDQHLVIPFYFRVRSQDRTAIAAAGRFHKEFVNQVAAFETAKTPIQNNQESDISTESGWIDPLIAQLRLADHYDERSCVLELINSAIRDFAEERRVVVMIDDVHNVTTLEGGDELLDDLINTFEGGQWPVIFSGYRRFLYDRTRLPHMPIGHLSFADAGQMVEELAKELGISINDQTRDLIAVQFGCRAGHISTFLAAAYDAGAELSTFSWTEQFYTDQIFGGRISRGLDAVIEQATPEIDKKRPMMQLLLETAEARHAGLPVDRWKELLGLESDDVISVIEFLHHNEIVNLDGTVARIEPDNLLLADHINSQVAIHSRRPRALVVGEAMARNIKRAPELMTRFYRKAFSIGVLDILRSFDGREISSGFLDYGRYSKELKGVSRTTALQTMLTDDSRILLPKHIFSASTSAYYPLLDEICDPERSATTICSDGDGGEIAWLAAEIDSKLEATRDVAEFWCDRLEMVALSSNFENYRIWLIANEGFDPPAMEMLSSRGAIGSSREQAEMLKELLGGPPKAGDAPSAETYEFVVPMGGDTEMIAAHTVEEIARRHNYPPKVINQLKTALVEACINASEHSLSPDRRLRQTFEVDDDKITITVGNRGVRLKDKRESRPENEARRGWGLKLIRTLMDEVRLADTDDGTVITMIKYVPVPNASHAHSH